MTIQQTKDGETLTMAIEGRIDTLTAPELKTQIEGAIDGVMDLILDFSKVDYISSAGLRSLMTAQNWMDARDGSMVIRNASKNIQGIFKVTGLDSFLVLECFHEKTQQTETWVWPYPALWLEKRPAGGRSSFFVLLSSVTSVGFDVRSQGGRRI